MCGLWQSVAPSTIYGSRFMADVRPLHWCSVTAILKQWLVRNRHHRNLTIMHRVFLVHPLFPPISTASFQFLLPNGLSMRLTHAQTIPSNTQVNAQHILYHSLSHAYTRGGVHCVDSLLLVSFVRVGEFVKQFAVDLHHRL